MSGARAKVAAIVLAAGRSSRMAPENKLIAEIGGEPIIRRVAATALASQADPVIVVTGFDNARVAEALRGLEVRIVHNPDYAAGMSGSLRVGLAALPRTTQGALICLGDMPEIDADLLKALLAAFAARGSKGIVVPVRDGRQGNPVLWSSDYFAEMQALSGDRGAKDLLARHADVLTKLDVSSDSIFIDVDDPHDLARLQARPVKD